MRHYLTIGLFVVASSCVIGGVAWTLTKAFQNPVEMDDTFLQTYQKTDDNYNELKLSEQRFKQKYDVQLLATTLSQAGGTLALNVISKEKNSTISGVNIHAKLTRPDTSKYDQNLTFSFNGNSYTAIVQPLPKLGRWQLKANIQEGETGMFITQEYFIK